MISEIALASGLAGFVLGAGPCLAITLARRRVARAIDRAALGSRHHLANNFSNPAAAPAGQAPVGGPATSPSAGAAILLNSPAKPGASASPLGCAGGRAMPPATFPSVAGGGAPLVWKSPEEHAEALADWVLDPGPRGCPGATIEATALIEMHGEMCIELGWEQRSWQPVAVAFMATLGIRKRYGSKNGRRVRVYEIPHSRPAMAPVVVQSSAIQRAA